MLTEIERVEIGESLEADFTGHANRPVAEQWDGDFFPFMGTATADSDPINAINDAKPRQSVRSDRIEESLGIGARSLCSTAMIQGGFDVDAPGMGRQRIEDVALALVLHLVG